MSTEAGGSFPVVDGVEAVVGKRACGYNVLRGMGQGNLSLGPPLCFSTSRQCLHPVFSMSKYQQAFVRVASSSGPRSILAHRHDMATGVLVWISSLPVDCPFELEEQLRRARGHLVDVCSRGDSSWCIVVSQNFLNCLMLDWLV